MNREIPYLNHLQEAQSLVTSSMNTRAYQSALRAEQHRLMARFSPYAYTFMVKAGYAKILEELPGMRDVGASLVVAAGVSVKDAAKLSDAELERRYLAVYAQSIAGKIHELPKVWAQREFSEFVASNLRIAGREFEWLHKEDKRWRPSDALLDVDQVKAFAWTVGYRPRVLAYNLGVPLIKTEEEMAIEDDGDEPKKGGKNVDICLLESTPEQFRSKTKRPKVIRDAQMYIALGELKGGIDPAGADEHWKTASAHLERIRRSFDGFQSKPLLFFIGNAIEVSMAGEIWSKLQSGTLSNAANLTDPKQAVSLVTWLCSL